MQSVDVLLPQTLSVHIFLLFLCNNTVSQYLPLVEELIEQVRARQHDFNNQMMVVMGMMEMGEWMAAEDMLGEMEKRIGEV